MIIARLDDMRAKQRRADRRDRDRAGRAARRAAASRPRSRGGRSSPIRSGARWSTSRSPSSSSPTSSASASSSRPIEDCYRVARRRPHAVAERAGPLQGLHLDAEAERLPVDPHHRRRARAPARRTADPHAAHARRSPSTASRRTRSTRTARRARRRHRWRGRAAPITGCAAPSRCWPKATVAEEFLEHTKLELFHDQVFCFTPKGRLIALPRGATPIDFAYAVHTDSATRRSAPRSTAASRRSLSELQNGDEVEIAARRRPGAAGRLGGHRRHRQGARRHPPRHARRRAGAICGPRPADRRARLRARRQDLRGRQAARRVLPRLARTSRRGRARGRRAGRDVLRRRRQGRPPGLQGGAQGRRRRPRRGGGRLVRDREGREPVFKVPGAAARIARAAIPIRGPQRRPAGALRARTAAPCRATASSASSRRARGSPSTRSSRRR